MSDIRKDRIPRVTPRESNMDSAPGVTEASIGGPSPRWALQRSCLPSSHPPGAQEAPPTPGDLERELPSPFLHVFTSNHAAIALYRKLGFALRKRMHLVVLGNAGGRHVDQHPVLRRLWLKEFGLLQPAEEQAIAAALPKMIHLRCSLQPRGAAHIGVAGSPPSDGGTLLLAMG